MLMLTPVHRVWRGFICSTLCARHTLQPDLCRIGLTLAGRFAPAPTDVESERLNSVRTLVVPLQGARDQRTYDPHPTSPRTHYSLLHLALLCRSPGKEFRLRLLTSMRASLGHHISAESGTQRQSPGALHVEWSFHS